MNRIIHPRVGSNYESTGLRKHKIMIMGESSYHADSKRPGYDKANQTINAGDDAIGYDEGLGYWNKSTFYTRTSRMFGYEAQSYERRHEFWNSVLYYNYLQDVLQEPKQIPPSDLWLSSKPAFIETIEQYQPDIVISFSKRMWQHLPLENKVILDNEFQLQCWSGNYKTTTGKNIKVYGFKHQSSFGFHWQTISKLIDQLIPNKMA